MTEPRIAITGATGFIGRALCDRYGDPRTWTALGRRDPSAFLPVGFRRVDMKDVGVDAVPAGTDILVHLATARTPDADVMSQFEGNAAGALRLFESARASRVRRLVLVSTTSVYEPASPPVTLLREEDRRIRYRPLPYAFAKKWAEDMARLEALLSDPPMSLWILRPGVVIGPGPAPDAWPSRTLRRLRAGEPYPLTGQTGHRLGLVVLEDVVEALIHAIGSPLPATCEPPGPVWNLVSEAWWERDVVEAMARSAGVVPRFAAPIAHDPFGWNREALGLAADGSRWLHEAGGVKPRPVEPALAALAASPSL